MVKENFFGQKSRNRPSFFGHVPVYIAHCLTIRTDGKVFGKKKYQKFLDIAFGKLDVKVVCPENLSADTHMNVWHFGKQEAS